MPAPRLWLLAVSLALTAFLAPMASPTLAAPSSTSNSPQAIKAYRSALARVLNMFMPANSKIIDTGNDLTRVNWKKAAADSAVAVSGMQKAKRALDRLAVPPRGARIQALMEQSFGTFLTGARLMHSGADKRSLAAIQSGQKTYQQGLPPLQQATALFSTLK